jgi:hypothetical protein
MRFQRLLGVIALASSTACAATGPSDGQVETAKARLDVAWLALSHTSHLAADRLDEGARTICLTRLSKLNDQLAYSGMLVVMSAAVPDLDDFRFAERAILRVEQEILRIDGEINRGAQDETPGS